ncbi:protein PRRC1-like [Tubulanus polymorphus]|uniref:protein PRRC1-like n=1 Tax=Tubulanus polymorphus TaxID=672921 RepID=UPI003DA2636E
MMEETNEETEKSVEVDSVSNQLQEAAIETETKQETVAVTPAKVSTTIPEPVPVVIPASPIAPPAFNITPVIPTAAPSSGPITPPVFPTSPAMPAVAPVYPTPTVVPTVVPVAPPSQGVPRENEASIDIDISSSNSVPASPSGTGIIGWFAGSRIINKMKTGMETMITTLDPGMKEYIRSGGDIDIVITSEQETKVSAVREAFQTVFGKATVRPQASHVTTAPQPVGYTSGVKSAEERITNLRRSGEIASQQPVISVENFMAELLPDKWFDIGCLLLKDPRHDIELQLFTQAIPIPTEIVSQIQDETPADYNLRWSGFSVTLGEVIQKRMPHVDRKQWHLAYSGVSRREMLLIAARSLAGIYQQRLPTSLEI